MRKQTLFILPVALLLSACLPVNDNPKQVAHNYWNAVKNGDHETARKLVSSHSQQDYENYINLPDTEKVAIKHVELDSEYASVSSILNPAGDTKNDHRPFNTILVLENGQWKIDAARTVMPSPKTSAEQQMEELTEKLTESMQDNIDTLDNAMSEGMELLNDVLREGSSEMGESLLKGMRELNENMRKSIDNMKQQREHKNSVDDTSGEGIL